MFFVGPVFPIFCDDGFFGGKMLNHLFFRILSAYEIPRYCPTPLFGRWNLILRLRNAFFYYQDLWHINGSKPNKKLFYMCTW
jgi:hypothetical protein